MEITISVSLFDSGCLPRLLERELAAVVKRQAAIRATAEMAQEIEQYRSQLANCLAAVNAARPAA